MIVLAASPSGRLAVLFEPRDLWVGVYVGRSAVFVCPLPCLVIRWRKGGW